MHKDCGVDFLCMYLLSLLTCFIIHLFMSGDRINNVLYCTDFTMLYIVLGRLKHMNGVFARFAFSYYNYM